MREAISAQGKMMKFLSALIILTLLLLPGVLHGQAKVATAGAQFLEIGVSARAVAMGGSFTSIADDASAVYYNPAGMTQIFEKEFMFSHIDYVADMNYEF
ncbi:MAG: hypothetical protein GF310_06450, partial [candidate division Zixibacteria bacterium]|nr:hypothetical protein [candidate division Zixibacteria bacterium]